MLTLAFFACCCSCSSILGKHVVHIQSKRDILAAAVDTDDILIPALPLQDYPLLSKFRHLRQVSFYTPDGTGGSDEKLKALAAVDLPDLKDIGLLNCPSVTDTGIQAIVKIRSLRELQLEGTSVSDQGCVTMADQMTLQGINVANCARVTKNGISTLAKSPTITGMGFSADNLSQHEVEQLIESFTHVNWCQIVDLIGNLDESALKAKGAQKRITVVVMPYGALHSMRMTDAEHRELLKKRGQLK